MSRARRTVPLVASLVFHAGVAALLAAIGVGTMILGREARPRPNLVIESRSMTPEEEAERVRAPVEEHDPSPEDSPEVDEPPVEPLVFADLPIESDEAADEVPADPLFDLPPPVPFGKLVVVRAVRPASAPTPPFSPAPNPPAPPSPRAALASAATAPAPLTAENRPPEYPSTARRRGFEGVVIVRARVGPDGRCLFALIVTSSGHAVLDEAALAAVRTWTFEPARRGGAPVEGEIDLPIRFEIASAEGRPPRAE